MVEASRYYVVRGKNGASDQLKKDVASILYAQDPQRVLSGGMGTTSISNFAEIRRAAYRDDRGVMMMMAAVSVILLSVTTAGIVGLTSFWVSQRRKQIGVRRALGATRADIAGYFLLENAFVSAVGVVLGAGLAFALNNYLMKEFELARMAVGNVLVGAAVLMLIGQMASLAPALGATRVSPSEVIR
jgi:putative ABC transport system permease protein